MIDIIIVTYFSQDQINDCIQSVIMQTIFSKCRVWIVDNASQDDTIAICEKLLRPNIELISLNKNIGFGQAVNEAARRVTNHFIYLLNPDAILTNENDLSKLLEFAHLHPNAGVIGTRIVSIASTQEILPRQFYPKKKNASISFSYLPGKFAWVLGASLLLRTDAFRRINGFDPDFFLYGEEVDLCLRMRRSGFEIDYDKNVIVKHIGSASANQLPNKQKKILKMKGLYLFLQKHYSKKSVDSILRKDKRRALFRYCIAKVFFLRKAENYRIEWHFIKQLISERC